MHSRLKQEIVHGFDFKSHGTAFLLLTIYLFAWQLGKKEIEMVVDSVPLDNVLKEVVDLVCVNDACDDVFYQILGSFLVMMCV